MKKLIPMLLLVGVVACNRAEESIAGVAAGAPEPQSRTAASAAMPRMIVRTADVRILVADTSKTVDAVTKSVESAGGYVSGSNIWREGELLRAKITLRVPADKLTATLASIRGLAKRVETETISSEDVSQEFVDLTSQVRNLEATEAELLELLKVARVNSKKATDVLEVHEQLTTIRGEIEQSRGRMRYLSQVTSMSSIALDIVPDAPVMQSGWQPLVEVKDASRALVTFLQRAATVTIWFVIYILPILGMLTLVITAIVKIARRARTREAN